MVIQSCGSCRIQEKGEKLQEACVSRDRYNFRPLSSATVSAQDSVTMVTKP